MRKLLKILVAFELTTLITFFFAAYKADRAMDKSGIGDLELWSLWTNTAGYAFGLLGAFWLLAFGLIAWSAIQSGNLLHYQVSGLPALVLCLPPAIFLAGYVGLFLVAP